MDANEISRLMFPLFAKSQTHFLGVFPSDQIPSPDYIETHTPCTFIANVDQHGSAGSHWVAIYVPIPHRLEFFDSYGRHPLDFGFHFPKYYQITHNVRQVQSLNSTVCGEYCIYVVYFRSRGNSMTHLVSRLASMSHVQSDKFVATFTRNLMSKRNLI